MDRKIRDAVYEMTSRELATLVGDIKTRLDASIENALEMVDESDEQALVDHRRAVKEAARTLMKALEIFAMEND